MNAYILYHPKTRQTGRAIMHGLNCSGGLGKSNCEIFTHIIRWGSAQAVSRFCRVRQGIIPKVFVNQREAVILASSKYRAFEELSAAGVSVPEFTRDARKVLKWNSEEFTVFGRNFRHTCGRDIDIMPPLPGKEHIENIPSSDFYTKYILPRKEYRIHVCFGEILIAQKKIWDENLFHEEDGGRIMAERGRVWAMTIAGYIRNHRFGWKFVTVNDLDNIPTNVKEEAICAVDVLGLHFGAVDVISTNEIDENGKRKAYVLEVNTAPGLEGESLKKYISAFDKFLRKDDIV